VLDDGARGVGDARALLLAALGGEVGGARGAAVLDDGARGVSDARAFLVAALGGDVGGARGAAVSGRMSAPRACTTCRARTSASQALEAECY
jgi:hypothetical protein